MSEKTVRLQIESPLAHVKARIDEIHAVIEKHQFVKPMIVDSGIRKSLFSNAVVNTQRIERVLREAVGNAQVPSVPVSPIPCVVPRKPNATIARNDAKISVATQREAQARLERRKHNHRNCCPPIPGRASPGYTGPVAQQPDWETPRSPTRTIETAPIINIQSVPVVESRSNRTGRTSPHTRSKSQKVDQMIVLDPTLGDQLGDHKSEGMKVTPGQMGHEAELEKLIRDTDELLSAEGILTDNQEGSLSDIEREIEKLTSVSLRKTDPRVSQLERDLNNLINQHL